jgi:hypothetical protein
MKVVRLQLEKPVAIPGWTPIAGGADSSEMTFHAADGWDIRETLPGVFSIWREGMDSPVTVGNYGYSYTQERDSEPYPEQWARQVHNTVLDQATEPVRPPKKRVR